MKRKFHKWLLELWFTSYEGAVIRDGWKKQGADRERERIIKLLEDSEELQSHIYFWLEFGENDTEGRDRKALSIALIKGENK